MLKKACLYGKRKLRRLKQGTHEESNELRMLRVRANQAVREAAAKALGSGSAILVARGDKLIRLHPDGREEFVEEIAPPVPLKKGSRLIIP